MIFRPRLIIMTSAAGFSSAMRWSTFAASFSCARTESSGVFGELVFERGNLLLQLPDRFVRRRRRKLSTLLMD